jgi:nitrous oxidase accessory protein NosD
MNIGFFRRTASCTFAMVFAAVLGIASPVQADGKTFKVDCDKGQTIGHRLANNVGDGDIIEVSGTCTEDIIISRSRITLDCLSPANASIVATGTATQAIQIQGSNVTVTNCEISGGSSLLGAVTVTRNGSATIEKNKITAGTGANGSGVGVAQNSYGRIIDNEIGGGVTGVIVTSGSMADLFRNDISGATTGVLIINSAAADIVKNTITGRGLAIGSGVVVTRTSTGNFSNDVIFGEDPNTIQNFGIGIACSAFSVVRFGFLSGLTVPQSPGSGNSTPTSFSLTRCENQGTAFSPP